MFELDGEYYGDYESMTEWDIQQANKRFIELLFDTIERLKIKARKGN